MIKTYGLKINVRRGLIYLASIFIISCNSAPATLQPLLATSGVTEDSYPSNNYQNVVDITPLPSKREFIIYNKYATDTNLEEIWALDPVTFESFLVATEIIPRGWSPITKKWLFTNKGTIFISNEDGSELRTIFVDNKYAGIDPFWLSDDKILFNAYKDSYSPPDIYILEINGEVALHPYPEKNKFVQSVFPSDDEWLLGDWEAGNY